MDASKEEFNIWYTHEIFYIESMLSITRSSMTDQSLLRSILDEINLGKNENQYLIIDLVQNIISHSASISRYFWPSSSNGIHKKRGRQLRNAFEIEDSNPIRDRGIRNFIEHFDEKLDKYLQKEISGNVIPSFVGNKDQIDGNVEHYFRAYFIDEWRFHVLGLEYAIDIIIEELIRIHIMLLRFRENGRLPNSN